MSTVGINPDESVQAFAGPAGNRGPEEKQDALDCVLRLNSVVGRDRDEGRRIRASAQRSKVSIVVRLYGGDRMGVIVE
jgi:hypothetical protein